jgi:hypothetical protein
MTLPLRRSGRAGSGLTPGLRSPGKASSCRLYGRNYGTITYEDPAPSNKEHTLSIYPGWTKSFPQDTVWIGLSITGWSGTYNC